MRRVGYLPEERGLLQQAGVLDVLRYLGRLKGLDGISSGVEKGESFPDLQSGLGEDGADGGDAPIPSA